MKWRFSVGRYSGIDVYVHATFFLLLAWIAFSYWSRGGGLIGALGGIVYVLAIFLCVVLHEFGHALAARKFGVATRDIILLPIGGVARLERMPREPIQELYVALAGPAVNLAIAGVLYVFLTVTGTLIPLSNISLLSGPFFERLMAINIFLMVFNLIPAFPMDGGRVLRAILAMRGDYVQATQRAARLGQGFAFLFGLAGLLYGNPMLLLIAFFVWIGAAHEANAAQMSSAIGGIPVSHAMIRDFKHLDHNDPLGKAVELTIGGSQNDFPVVRDGDVVGVLTQNDLIASIREYGEEITVNKVMRESFVTVDSDEMLDVALGRLNDCQCHTLPVLKDGSLTGLMTMSHIGEFVRLQSARNIETPDPNLPN